MCTTYLDSLSCPSQAFYDIPIVLEGENEKDDENMVLGIVHLFNKQLMKTQLLYT
jgi:hypothetical protein